MGLQEGSGFHAIFLEYYIGSLYHLNAPYQKRHCYKFIHAHFIPSICKRSIQITGYQKRIIRKSAVQGTYIQVSRNASVNHQIHSPLHLDAENNEKCNMMMVQSKARRSTIPQKSVRKCIVSGLRSISFSRIETIIRAVSSQNQLVTSNQPKNQNALGTLPSLVR
jgi:hypothetical protein